MSHAFFETVALLNRNIIMAPNLHLPPKLCLTPCMTEPVDYPFTVQVLKATADLSGVEDGPLLVKARVAHVVDVKL